jgi:uncharacterized protein YecT (DUF1311 family)
VKYVVAVGVAATLWAGASEAKPQPGQADLQAMERCSSNMSSGVGYENCLRSVERRARSKVNNAYARNLRAARDLDTYIRNHKTKIEALRGWPLFTETARVAQTEWVKSADAQCQLEGNTNFGGSGNDRISLECHIRHNVQRLSELEKSYERLSEAVKP